MTKLFCGNKESTPAEYYVFGNTSTISGNNIKLFTYGYVVLNKTFIRIEEIYPLVSIGLGFFKSSDVCSILKMPYKISNSDLSTEFEFCLVFLTMIVAQQLSVICRLE
jgi:hypothetical protein